MRSLIAMVLVPLSGACDLAYQLERPPEHDAALPGGHVVTGTFKQKYVMNDSALSPVTGERTYDSSALTISVRLDDQTEAPVVYRDDGTFTFSTATAGQAYRIAITADGGRFGVQHTASDLRLAAMVAGRPDRLPPVPTTIQFPYPIVGIASSTAMITSTGVYSQTATTLYGPTVNFDWRLATYASGGLSGLLDGGRNDRVYAFENVADATTIPGIPYTRIAAAASTSITQSAGSTAVLAQPAPVASNTCARILAPNALEHARITAAVPRTYTISSSDWIAYMAPAPDAVGLAGAIYVAISGQTPARDLDIAPIFHDPYVGMTLVMESFSAATFGVALPSTTPLLLSNNTRRYDRAERGNPASCTPARTDLSARVGLAGRVTLDDTPLDVDGKRIAIDRSRDVRVAWTLVAGGQVDYVTIGVHELLDVGGSTRNAGRLGELVAGQSFALLDPALFESGHRYIVVVVTSIGRPHALSGDLETLALPFENATMWSHYFEVR